MVSGWPATRSDRAAAVGGPSGVGVVRDGRWAPPLALAAGAALPLGFAPFGAWPVALASVGGLFLLLRGASTGRRALLLGWLYGVGKYGVGVSWVYVSISVYGRAPAPLAAAIVAGFVAGLAILCGAGGWAFHGLRRALGRGGPAGGDARPWVLALHFAWLWLALEWSLTWLLTGFPWLFVGYAFIDTPLAGFAPVGGVLAVSLAAVCTAALGAAAVAGRPAQRRRQHGGAAPLAAWGGAAALAAVWIAGWGLGEVAWTERGERRGVSLVQGNLPQETKWTPEGWRAALARYEALSAPVWDSDIVLWPEAAIPAPHRYNAARIDAMRQGARGDLVLGATVREVRTVREVGDVRAAGDGEVPLQAAPARYYNAAVSTAGGVYRKRHLVPFGEYVPWRWLLGDAIALFDLPMADLAPGASKQAPLQAAGLDLATAICYEVAYPRRVAMQARDAALLVVLSNDTWFGASIGPPQHLQIARMRALETGRFLARATNNGVTAIVDERGTVVERLPQFQPGVLTGEVYATVGATPFARSPVSPALAALALWPLLIAARAAFPNRPRPRPGRAK